MVDLSPLAKAANNLLEVLRNQASGQGWPSGWGGNTQGKPPRVPEGHTGLAPEIPVEEGDWVPPEGVEDGSLPPGHAVDQDKKGTVVPLKEATLKLNEAVCNLTQVLAKANPPPAAKPKKPQYSAAILTPESQQALLKAFPGVHPNVIAHHMTLAFGPNDQELAKLQEHVNQNGGGMKLRVKGHHQDEHGQAVSIEAINPITGQPMTTKGGPLHITISHNGGSDPGPDGKPVKRVHPTLKDEKGKPVAINAAYSNHLVSNTPGTPVNGLELDANIAHVMPDNSEVPLSPQAKPVPA